jgi:hypothetical protein
MTATATQISGAAGVITVEGTLDARAPEPKASGRPGRAKAGGSPSTTGRERPRE